MSTSRSATPSTRPEAKHQQGCERAGPAHCRGARCRVAASSLGTRRDFAAGASPDRCRRRSDCRKAAPTETASADVLIAQERPAATAQATEADKPASVSVLPKPHQRKPLPLKRNPQRPSARRQRPTPRQCRQTRLRRRRLPRRSASHPPGSMRQPPRQVKKTASTESGCGRSRPACPRSGGSIAGMDFRQRRRALVHPAAHGEQSQCRRSRQLHRAR